jgi:hypothetical protein
MKKLNAGCGRDFRPGYINFDICDKRWDGQGPDVVGDIRELDSFFPRDSLEEIVCFQVLEHLIRHDVQVALKKFYKVLALGGQLVIEGPDILKLYEWYIDGKHTFDVMERLIYGTSGDPGWENADFHRSGWTVETMKLEVEAAGFEVVATGPGTDERTAYTYRPCGRAYRIEAVKK